MIAQGESASLVLILLFSGISRRKEREALLSLIPVCTFLNSQSGLLCIRMNDDKLIGGLDANSAIK